MLADEDKAVAIKYGVLKEKSMYGKKYMGIDRTTFVISPEGKISAVLTGLKPDEHAAAAMAALKSEVAAIAGLLRSRNRKGENTLRRDPDFLLAGSDSNSCASACSGRRANGRTLTASGKCADQRSCACSAADLGGVALGMALSLAGDARAIDSLTIDGGQPQRERARFVQASTAVHVCNFAFDRRTRPGDDLAMFNNVMSESPAPAFSGVSGGRTQRSVEPNGRVASRWNGCCTCRMTLQIQTAGPAQLICEIS